MLKDVEPAPLDHPMAAFLGDLAKCVLGIVEDDYEEVLNPKMKQAFGWDENEVGCDFAQRRGRVGWFPKICGVLCELSWFAGGVDRDNVTILLDAIAKKYVSQVRKGVQRT